MPEDPETAYYNVSGRRAADNRTGRRAADHPSPDTAGQRYGDGYGVGRDAYGRTADASRPADPYAQPRRDPYAQDLDRYRDAGYDDATRLDARGAGATRQARNRRVQERGLPGWAALVVLVGIAGVAGLVDSISGSTVRGVFNWGLVVASLVAILVVRRSQMFAVVIAPPLVYLVASAGLLYVRTGGLSSRSKILDVATNWIVYGFPAIAGATAAVLLVAGIRLVTRK